MAASGLLLLRLTSSFKAFQTAVKASAQRHFKQLKAGSRHSAITEFSYLNLDQNMH